MNFRKIDGSPKTFILVFQTGDELAEGILRFAKERKLSAASFKAVHSRRCDWDGSVGKANDMSRQSRSMSKLSSYH
jgi:hypothetical protein